MLIYSTYNIFRSSSMGGHLHLKKSNTLLCLPYCKFNILIRSDQWLLSYNPFLWGWVSGWLVNWENIALFPLGRVWQYTQFYEHRVSKFASCNYFAFSDEHPLYFLEKKTQIKDMYGWNQWCTCGSKCHALCFLFPQTVGIILVRYKLHGSYTYTYTTIENYTSGHWP